MRAPYPSPGDRRPEPADRLARGLARLRLPLFAAGAALIVSVRWHETTALYLAGIGLVVIMMVTFFVPIRRVRQAPIPVACPVAGRWIAVNSPADKVPSHGMHAYGQTYAIDLVHVPDPDTEWARLRRWPLMSRPESFPSFGRPVLAPADGVVVRTAGRQRDHLSRNSWPALVYMFVEGMFRELFGARGVLGNHVILDLGNGVYAACAHLRRGSVRVRTGQRVTAGEQLAECGNSGNSSEPHLHFQLMDHRSIMIAAGLPFSFEFRTDRPHRDGADGHNGDLATTRSGAPVGQVPFVGLPAARSTRGARTG